MQVWRVGPEPELVRVLMQLELAQREFAEWRMRFERRCEDCLWQELER